MEMAAVVKPEIYGEQKHNCQFQPISFRELVSDVLASRAPIIEGLKARYGFKRNPYPMHAHIKGIVSGSSIEIDEAHTELTLPVNEFPVYNQEVINFLSEKEPHLFNDIFVKFSDTEGNEYGIMYQTKEKLKTATLYFSKLFGMNIDSEGRHHSDNDGLKSTTYYPNRTVIMGRRQKYLDLQSEAAIKAAKVQETKVVEDIARKIKQEAEERGIDFSSSTIYETVRNHGGFTVLAEWARSPQRIELRRADSSSKKEFEGLIEKLTLSSSSVELRISTKFLKNPRDSKLSVLEQVVEGFCRNTLDNIFVQKGVEVEYHYIWRIEL